MPCVRSLLLSGGKLLSNDSLLLRRSLWNSQSISVTKAGIAVATAGQINSEMVMRSLVGIVMAGIIAVYGLVVSVVITGNIGPGSQLSLHSGFVHLGAGLAVGFSGMAAGYAIGIVGHAFVKNLVRQSRLFIGMILVLIFAEVLGLYGFIVALILTTRVENNC